MNQFRITDPATWSLPIVITIAALALAGGTLLLEFIPVAVTLATTHSRTDSNPALTRALETHEALMKTSTDRFTGRSLFTMPAAPPRRPAPQPEPVAPPPPPPPPPPPSAPEQYSGTKPTGVLGPTVFFGENLAIRVGETRNGITVLGVEPRSNVRIEHMGGEYVVPIWAPTDWSKLSAAVDGQRPSFLRPIVKPAVPAPPPPQVKEGRTETVAQEVPLPPVVVPPIGLPPVVVPPIGVRDAALEGSSAPNSVVAPQPLGVPSPAQDSSDSSRVVSPPPAGTAAPTPSEESRDAPDADASDAARETPRPPAAPNVLPPPLSADQISRMSRSDVTVALARTTRARQLPNLDQSTKDRLRVESGLLRERQSALPR